MDDADTAIADLDRLIPDGPISNARPECAFNEEDRHLSMDEITRQLNALDPPLTPEAAADRYMNRLQMKPLEKIWVRSLVLLLMNPPPPRQTGSTVEAGSSSTVDDPNLDPGSRTTVDDPIFDPGSRTTVDDPNLDPGSRTTVDDPNVDSSSSPDPQQEFLNQNKRSDTRNPEERK